MIEREILKDTGQYEPKLMLGMTTRQCVSLIIGAVIAVPAGIIMNKYLFSTYSIPLAGLLAVPFFLCGWYKPYGIPMEKFIWMVLKTALLSPSQRKYKMEISYLKPEIKKLSKKELKIREKKYLEEKKIYKICN